jgi:hypothetical protein
MPFIAGLLPIMPFAPFAFFCSSVAPSTAACSVLLDAFWEAVLPRRSASFSREALS